MRFSPSAVRSIAVIALTLVAVISLERAPEYAWGGVTLDGQRYKFSASYVYAVVPPGATPPAFMGCRWTAPANKSEICWPAKGGTLAAWMIGFTPLAVSLAALTALVSAGVVLLGLFQPVAARFSTRLLAATTGTALVAMVIPFFSVTYAVGALQRGSVFFGALGTDYMLSAFISLSMASWLTSYRPSKDSAQPVHDVQQELSVLRRDGIVHSHR